MEHLDFCYSLDENETQGAMMANSIESLLRVYGGRSLSITIIVLGRADGYAYGLAKEIQERHEGVDIRTRFAHADMCQRLPLPTNSKNRGWLGYNALIRFFVPCILNGVESIYHVDNDILFVEDAWEKLTDFDEKATLLRGWKLWRNEEVKCNERLNTGFMYMNLAKWRDTPEIMKEVEEYFVTRRDEIRGMNEDCFTWLALERYKDVCEVLEDPKVNTLKLWDGVEVYHGAGHPKTRYFETYERYKEKVESEK